MGVALPRPSALLYNDNPALPDFSSSIVSSANALNYAVMSKFGKLLIWKLMPRYGFDIRRRAAKRKQKAWREQNPKRHMPPVSLLLGYKIMAICSFIWLLGLLPWSVRQTKF